MVDTPAVLDSAVCAVTRQIPRAIQALATAKRVYHKAFSSQRRALVIAARQADACQIQLTNRTLG